ncbi:hypothetical protein DM02DRAFT_699582 [Periconia macrospinosa]|uniref:Mid2 domain-containing protein n=1 Tax=Periconia macrospinosa TaxID=97972 RepID=A0A2V1DX10_9PLEO|nr:hypothetical protein DM02DRAFT_699582 [Periconia macrospinosa]
MDQVNSASYFLQGQTSISSCFPENYDPKTTAIYNPGVCPSGYTPARAAEEKALSTIAQAPSAKATQTCCPTYAVFEAREPSQDVLFMSTMACQSFFGASGVIRVTSLSGDSLVTKMTSYAHSDVLNAYGIVIAVATTTSSVMKESGTDLAQTTSFTSIVPTSTSTSTSTPASSLPPSTPSGGLTTAQKAGVGGGIIGGVLILALIGGLLYYIRQLKRKQSPPIGPKEDSLSIREFDDASSVHELIVPAKYAHELPTGRRSNEAHELPSGIYVHELYTGTPR